MATGEVDRSFSGAYGRERRGILKYQSTVVQQQRMRQFKEEMLRNRKRYEQALKHMSLSPKKLHEKVPKKAPRLTRLIEVRAGYYEAELLKELKVRKESVDKDIEKTDVIPNYKEYRTTNPHASESPGRPRQPERRDYHTPSSSKDFAPLDTFLITKGRWLLSDSSTAQDKNFSTPLKGGSQRIISGQTVLNRSLVSVRGKVLQMEQDIETRRERILERSILELDKKLARLAHHRQTSSLTDAPKRSPPRYPRRS